MSRGAACLLVFVLLSPSGLGAAEPQALAKARALYNAADYDGAISSAATAQGTPGAADAAALVTARAYLERYRHSGTAADLVTARETLATIDASALTLRDQVDLLVGLGQSLYLGNMFGPAAELFDTALSGAWLLASRDRVLLLDWWASTVVRETQVHAPDRRIRTFERVAMRMQDELRQDPGNAAANYWLVAAARGMGDSDAAWNAAVAGWVRAGLTPRTSRAVRADLDRLVLEAVIPEHARAKSPREAQEAQAALIAEWEAVKSQWK